MDDARRFLRIVMPGFVFGLETIAWLFIVFPEWTRSQVTLLAGKDSLEVVLGGILASGVLGYIFATVHRWWLWHVERGINHSRLINRLIKRGFIPNESVDQTLDRTQALVISLALWYERVGQNRLIDVVADEKLTAFADYTHGLGAARVASVFALVTVLAFCVFVGTFRLDFEPVLRFGAMLILAVGITWLFQKEFNRHLEIQQAVYDAILEDALARERENRNGSPERVDTSG